jgi:hypothetical protein
VLHICWFYPGICLTTGEKARKNLSQGSLSVPAGTMKIHKHTIRIQMYNKNRLVRQNVMNTYVIAILQPTLFPRSLYGDFWRKKETARW